MKAIVVERALWVIGVMLIACYGAVRVGAEASRREGIESFTRLSAVPRSVPSEIAADPADQSLWSAARIRAYALDFTAHPNAVPEALLRIPSVKLRVPVYADTSVDSLNRGAGLISGTATPRAVGNMGIAAHRDGFFRALKDELRAMLDAHMFGRDSRELRDDAVRVAWQIDSMRPCAIERSRLRAQSGQ